jgi:hypothetical protein
MVAYFGEKVQVRLLRLEKQYSFKIMNRIAKAETHS